MANEPKNALQILKVIDRMEIGPVHLEGHRLKSPYTVFKNGKQDVIHFEYRFEEDVFDQDDPASINLANMMAAQVALNYGLFCEEIIFHGSFDKADQIFIRDMAANTAREIFVMKFLEPNPFLQGAAAQLPPVKLDNYVQAKITFSEEVQTFQNNWEVDPQRYTILSSGGKDSLLSYSLIKELGYETHPIFVNESGRHWFTALNAYRYFKHSYPETARVWTNSDRVFNWMLRHFPFVKQNFAQIRSDEYPIRLWTVAVFLFSVLPLLRKRKAGRLIIGDEFDTTVRLSHKGITHYNGLYDQSRYFDNALTRYFIRKGWNITQFSIVRPLSEMLIEKILAQRYPEHQKHQVSCHATHVEGERIYPCGQCEKCRRIVGMLTAIDVDPTHCGYKPQQIENCLDSLEKKSVHQEAVGAQHLFFLLKQKGLIRTKKHIRPHHEIMKLRFDPHRSRIEEIPIDLRKPLFEILLKYTEGALQKRGRIWEEFDVLSSPTLSKPYPFDDTLKKLESDLKQDHRFILGELTWPEAQQRFQIIDVALLPVGATEQHGFHLPLDTDAFDANYLACRVAEACEDPKPIVLPLIPYGVSYHHEDFSGTISITNETLAHLVYEIGMSVARNGIKKLVIINGHGGNVPSLQFAAQMINRDAYIFTCVDTGDTSDTDILSMTETKNDVHAGEIETSTTLAVRPNLVKLDKASKFVPHFSSRYLNFSSKRSVEWYARTAKISTDGVLGDPFKASREKGEKMWQVMIKNLVEFVEDLKSMTLDEIYERKY